MLKNAALYLRNYVFTANLFSSVASLAGVVDKNTFAEAVVDNLLNRLLLAKIQPKFKHVVS